MSADNLALSRGGYFLVASAGIAAGSTNTRINPSNGVVASFDGIIVTRASDAAGIPYAPINGHGRTVDHGEQPESTSCLYGVVMDSTGAVRITKGNVVSNAALASGSNVLQVPPLPANNVMLGFIRVVTNGSTTFMPGATGWVTSGSNIVVAFVNTLSAPISASDIPSNQLPSPGSAVYQPNGDVIGLRGSNGVVSLLSRTLLSTAIPFIQPSNFTMNNNGAFVMTVANTNTFNQGAYIWMQANAIFAGSIAGWYWCVMSSGSAGTVYNNVYLFGQPVIPAVPVPFVSTGPGAVTVVDLPLVTAVLPGGSMGPNGTIEVSFLCQGGAAVTKIVNAVLGSNVSIGSFGNTSSSSQLGSTISIRNAGSQSRQRFANSHDNVASLIGNASIDTTIDQPVGVRLRCDTPATEGLVLTGLTIKLWPAA